MTNDAVVIGAGVSGLTTAICLVEAGWAVQVWAAEPPRATTSAVAGALWGPSFLEPMAKTMAWTNRSLVDFTELAEDPATGVRMAPALSVSAMPAAGDTPPQARSIPDLRPCPPEDLPDGFASGFRATMPLIDMSRYLDHLVARLAKAGVEIELRTVRSLADAAPAAPVVVNCTGLGARDLVGDTEVRPVFGQHVMLANPGLDELFMELTAAAEWTSYFPHRDRVVCGGITVPDRWDRTPDPDVTDRILPCPRGRATPARRRGARRRHRAAAGPLGGAGGGPTARQRVVCAQLRARRHRRQPVVGLRTGSGGASRPGGGAPVIDRRARRFAREAGAGC